MPKFDEMEETEREQLINQEDEFGLDPEEFLRRFETGSAQ